jgi:hypothetical protein
MAKPSRPDQSSPIPAAIALLEEDMATTFHHANVPPAVRARLEQWLRDLKAKAGVGSEPE